MPSLPDITDQLALRIGADIVGTIRGSESSVCERAKSCEKRLPYYADVDGGDSGGSHVLATQATQVFVPLLLHLVKHTSLIAPQVFTQTINGQLCHKGTRYPDNNMQFTETPPDLILRTFGSFKSLQ